MSRRLTAKLGVFLSLALNFRVVGFRGKQYFGNMLETQWLTDV